MIRVKGFRSKPRVQNQIYRVMPGSGLVDAMAAGFSLPNGLAFSEDEKLLYVTDTGYKTGLVPCLLPVCLSLKRIHFRRILAA